MRQLCQILIVCALLIVSVKGFSQTPGSAPATVYTISAGNTIGLNGAANNAVAYQWYLNGTRISGATTKDYTTGTAGLYTVVAFNMEGCPSDVSDVVQVIVGSPVKPDTLVDLQIAINSTNTQAAVGQNFNYQLTANNNSQITGTEVRVTYTVPPQINYVPG